MPKSKKNIITSPSIFSANVVISNEGLLTEILLRVPVKSLVRCKMCIEKMAFFNSNPHFTCLKIRRFSHASGIFLYHYFQYYAMAVLDVVRGEKEDDSLLVLHIPEMVILRYNLVDKSFHMLCDFDGGHNTTTTTTYQVKSHTVESGEGRVYTDLTSTLVGRTDVSERPLAQDKA
ncbi:hypothetical protein RND71_022173 [Anisodus tanguticus]|uniref:Uncharacterized protein n=1 Tax=Anisodus tanguticus TaxID=243964 RepID=A0AAE1RZ73_9SOLA|nr:hypothetical protein RND71_022173 [Anisodus tanguticus]